MTENKGPSDHKISQLVEQSFNSGEVIIKEGEMDSGAYKIIEGEVAVTKQSGNSTVKLATLANGAIFGEMTLIDNKPHSATVTAVTDVECILIDKSTFDNELADSSPIIKDMLEAFSERLRGADNRISSKVE